VRTRKKLWLVVLAGVSCLATLTASAAGVAGAQSSSTQGVSNTEIKVGGLGDSAGFFTEANMGLGAEARFARANKSGELPGKRKITMAAWGDIKADTATSVQEERRLIEQEGVFAIVPNSSAFTAEQVPNQRKVPVFGFGISPGYCSAINAPNYFFGFDGCVVPPPTTKTVGDNSFLFKKAAEAEGIIKPGTKGKIAFIGPDNERAKFAIAGFYASATANGLDVVYAKASTPPPPAVVGDYTPYVQEVLATKPDIIFSLGVSSDYIGLAKALQAAQYQGMYVIPAADPQLAPIVGPSYAQTNWGPNEAASTTPAIQQMLDDFEAYKPGTVPGNAMVIGWLSADHFIAALKKAGKDLTREKLQQVASKMTYEQKGLIGPTPYPKNRVATTPNCHAFLKTDGKTYTVVENYSCVSKRYKIPSYDSIETG
jgi:ABC-type branched-subunit amino acid transport system substrate-binding protein